MDFEKAAPWLIGGAAVVAGIVLLRNGSGTNVGYGVVASPDNSVNTSAALQLNQAQIQAETNVIGQFFAYQHDIDLAKIAAGVQNNANSTAITLHTIDASVQQASIDAARTTAENHERTQTIGAIATFVGQIFCYGVSQTFLDHRRMYRHGEVS